MNPRAVLAIGTAVAGAAVVVAKLLSSHLPRGAKKESYRPTKAPRYMDPKYPTMEAYIDQPSDVEFTVALAKRLECDLRYLVGDEESDLFSMIDCACDHGVIDDATRGMLHQFRMARNRCVHGEGEAISQNQRRRWVRAVISLEEQDE